MNCLHLLPLYFNWDRNIVVSFAAVIWGVTQRAPHQQLLKPEPHSFLSVLEVESKPNQLTVNSQMKSAPSKYKTLTWSVSPDISESDFWFHGWWDSKTDCWNRFKMLYTIHTLCKPRKDINFQEKVHLAGPKLFCRHLMSISAVTRPMEGCSSASRPATNIWPRLGRLLSK